MPRARLRSLDVGDGHLDRARAEVQPEQRLGAHHAAPLEELVRAELVRLERIPGSIERHRPLRFRADPVEPVVAGDEIAPRIANDGHAEVFDFPRDVGAESLRIGEARPGLVHAGVDGAAQVFEERTEHTAIEVAPARRSAKKHPRGAGTCLRVARRQPDPATATPAALPKPVRKVRRSHAVIDSPFVSSTSFTGHSLVVQAERYLIIDYSVVGKRLPVLSSTVEIRL